VQHQPILAEQCQDIIEGYILRVVEDVWLRAGGLMGTHALIFAAEGMQDIGIGRLAGREVHSRSVMKEGARAAEEMMRWNLSIESLPVVGPEEFEQQDNDP
jgi:hypothetical protein